MVQENITIDFMLKRGYYSSSFVQVQRIGNDLLSRQDGGKYSSFLRNQILFYFIFLCLLLSFPLWAGSG